MNRSVRDGVLCFVFALAVWIVIGMLPLTGRAYERAAAVSRGTVMGSAIWFGMRLKHRHKPKE